jgi:hypothetical protein
MGFQTTKEARMTREDRSERLEAIQRDREEQDARWRKAREALAGLGRVELRVPTDFLEVIDSLATPRGSIVLGVRN